MIEWVLIFLVGNEISVFKFDTYEGVCKTTAAILMEKPGNTAFCVPLYDIRGEEV